MFNETCSIISNTELSSGIYEMIIKSDKMAKAALPGQFLHIKVNTGLHPLLRRPISIHKADKAAGTVAIIYHIVGKGTTEMSKLNTDDSIDVMGPLGKGFPVFSDKKCAVIGGGIGAAPLLELANNLKQCDAYLGFRKEAYKLSEFESCCSKVYTATEDGSIGHKGFAAELLEKNIIQYEVVYACGPKPMLQRVIDICSQNDIECYVSIEERMGCGIGACLVCACKAKEENGQWHHKKACKDGPVFNAKEVLLDD